MSNDDDEEKIFSIKESDESIEQSKKLVDIGSLLRPDEEIKRVRKISFVLDNEENDTEEKFEFLKPTLNRARRTNILFDENLQKVGINLEDKQKFNLFKKHSKSIPLHTSKSDSFQNGRRRTVSGYNKIHLKKRITLNIGGIRYQTYSSTLKLISESRLANLNESNSDYDPINKEYFFDRHPGAFMAILNFFRTGKLHAPTDLCVNLFSEELNFWGLNELSLEPCCWNAFSSQRDADKSLAKILNKTENNKKANEVNDHVEQDEFSGIHFSGFSIRSEYNRNLKEFSDQTKWQKLKQFYNKISAKAWLFFEDKNSSNFANIFYWISLFFLFISILNFVLETSSYFRVPYEIAIDTNYTRSERAELTVPHVALRYIEIFCNIFFSLQLLLRFLAAPNKLNFIRKPHNIFEFLSILPIFFPTEKIGVQKTWPEKIHNYLQIFYILRILRIFVLVPKYSGLRVLLLTLKASIGELWLYIVLLLLTLLLFATLIFYVEQIFEKDNNQFESILVSLWWAVVTITTLGYGDIVPQTFIGRIIGALCALCGLVFLALPIPVIVNNFTTFYAQAKGYQKLKGRADQREELLNRAMALHFNNEDTIHSKVDEDEMEIIEPGASILTQVSEKTIEKYPLTINNDSDNIKNIETKFKYNNRRRNNILKRELNMMGSTRRLSKRSILRMKSRLKHKKRRNAI